MSKRKPVEDNPWLKIPVRESPSPVAVLERDITSVSGGNIMVLDPPAPKPRPAPTAAALANLKPYQPGSQGNPGNFYPVSRALKDLMRDPKHSKAVAASLLEAAADPSNRGYNTALTTLLERTEGKVSGDEAKAATVNVLNVIVKDEATKLDIARLHDLGKSAQSAQLADNNADVKQIEAN